MRANHVVSIHVHPATFRYGTHCKYYRITAAHQHFEVLNSMEPNLAFNNGLFVVALYMPASPRLSDLSSAVFQLDENPLSGLVGLIDCRTR